MFGKIHLERPLCLEFSLQEEINYLCLLSVLANCTFCEFVYFNEIFNFFEFNLFYFFPVFANFLRGMSRSDISKFL